MIQPFKSAAPLWQHEGSVLVTIPFIPCFELMDHPSFQPQSPRDLFKATLQTLLSLQTRVFSCKRTRTQSGRYRYESQMPMAFDLPHRK